MLPLTWCACYFPKIIILRFKVISEKIRKNPVNTEKTFSMYYNARPRTAIFGCVTLSHNVISEKNNDKIEEKCSLIYF